MSYRYKCKNQKYQKNGPLKIKKFENPSTTLKFYVELGRKRKLGTRDPIIGSMGYGGVGV